MKREIVYFGDNKEDNTQEVFELVEKRMQEENLTKIVLASTTGKTAKKAIDYFEGKGITLIVIPHQNGFSSETNLFSEEVKEELLEKGHSLHIATMLFHTDKIYETTIPSIIAGFLRIFSNGVKVCIEIVLMAGDGGYLKKGEKIVAIAGTSKGADTALLMSASDTRHLENLQVNEILCKPYN